MQVGDKVRCLISGDDLTAGKVYKVCDIFTDGFYIRDDIGALNRRLSSDDSYELIHFPKEKGNLVLKEDHSGSKYMKKPVTYENGLSDIYCDLIKYEITSPAIQHAFKKVAMSGLRGKASKVQDLEEAIDALKQAILLERL